MARRKVQQIELPEVDTRARKGAVVEHETDFTAMDLGVGVGTGFVTVRCPVCLFPCVAMPGPATWAFIHRARFTAGPRHTRLEPIDACRLDNEIVAALGKIKAVTLTASGWFAGAETNAPQLATELEAARRERRRLTERKP